MVHLRVLDAAEKRAMLALLAALLTIVTCVGVVYFALQGSLLGVILSATIPGYGAVGIGGSAWRSLGLSG